jgi:EAL domain-containing protein (putative c-di-GMP-specific phosphodiesterase class I)
VVLSGVAGLVYALPWSISGAEQMLRQARSALRSGHRGGQQVTVYRVEDDTRGQSAIVLASELRTALPAGELELVYQPVLELATAIPVSVEALPQWLHPCRGVLLQAEWMPVLEQSDLVGRYLLWLLEEALEGYRAWYRCGVPVPVAVRLPGPALLDPALPGVVAAALSRAGVSPGQLIIEFSGNGMLAVTDVADQVLVELVDHGVGLAVDTAGLSLEQLCRVPASEIKLPGRTTELALWDQETRARVRGVVAFADELGLRVIAQDIPTAEHLDALIGLGVHAGQGPCMSRPRHASEMVGALQLAAELVAGARDATVITLPVRDQ